MLGTNGFAGVPDQSAVFNYFLIASIKFKHRANRYNRDNPNLNQGHRQKSIHNRANNRDNPNQS